MRCWVVKCQSRSRTGPTCVKGSRKRFLAPAQTSLLATTLPPSKENISKLIVRCAGDAINTRQNLSTDWLDRTVNDIPDRSEHAVLSKLVPPIAFAGGARFGAQVRQSAGQNGDCPNAHPLLDTSIDRIVPDKRD